MEIHKELPLSVVVPVYNVELYLKDCLDSLLAQSFKEFEIILIDDGSTDASGEICESYARKDGRIRLVHKKNGGLVSARKAGAKLAKGSYITYVDSDDKINTRMYEVLLGIAEQEKADIVVNGLVYLLPNQKKNMPNRIESGSYEGKKLETELLEKMIFSGEFYVPGIFPAVFTKLFKRDMLLNNQLEVDEKLTMGEDMACSYPCLLDARKVVVYNQENFYQYCYRKDSMSREYDKNYGKRTQYLYTYLEKCFAKKERADLEKQLCYHRLYLLEAGIENILKPGNGLKFNERFLEFRKLCILEHFQKGYQMAQREVLKKGMIQSALHKNIQKGCLRRAFCFALLFKIKKYGAFRGGK